MSRQYEAFCIINDLFYDSVTGGQGTDEGYAAGRPVPPGWRREPLDDWLMHVPAGASLPPQGWKIHVSACQQNASRVLDRVWDYCVARELAFKFVRTPTALLLRNSKYA